jgi:hypothetical protein
LKGRYYYLLYPWQTEGTGPVTLDGIRTPFS